MVLDKIFFPPLAINFEKTLRPRISQTTMLEAITRNTHYELNMSHEGIEPVWEG